MYNEVLSERSVLVHQCELKSSLQNASLLFQANVVPILHHRLVLFIMHLMSVKRGDKFR